MIGISELEVDEIREDALKEWNQTLKRTCDKCGVSLQYRDITILIDNGATFSDPLQFAGLIIRCAKCRKKYGSL